MAAWPPTPTVPSDTPRRSRSRSPRRKDSYSDTPGPDYAPYTGPGGADEDRRTSYGGDYYDRRGRGRSRSPGDEIGRKRRRSPSPYDRDRFDPRPRYNDDYGESQLSPPIPDPASIMTAPPLLPPQIRTLVHTGIHLPEVGAAAIMAGMTRSGRIPMDPNLYQPHPATLRQYAEWFRAFHPKEAKEEDDLDRQAEREAGKKTRDGIRARWEKYKKQHAQKQLEVMFNHHIKFPWFNEKYNPAPEYVNLRNRVRKDGWKGRPEQFLKDIEEGKYDPETQAEADAVETAAENQEIPVGEETNPAEDADAGDEDVNMDSPAKDSNGKQNGKSTIALDLYLEYLRAAYNTCYYCVSVCDHAEELQRKCPKHTRKPLSEAFLQKEKEKKEKEAGEENVEMKDETEEKPKEKERDRDRDRKGEKSDDRWTEWLDNKLGLVINRSLIDPAEHLGKSFEEELHKAVEPFVKQEDEGKYRCKTCNKLFKASAFVEKHVSNKHSELLKSLDDVPFFNNFVLDPHHIQPFSHVPPPMGNTTTQPEAFGLTSAPMQMPPPMGGYYMQPPMVIPGANGMYFDPTVMPGNPWGGAPGGGGGGNRRASGRGGDEPHGARGGGGRLQDRMGGFAGVEGLPPKPNTGHEPAMSGGGPGNGGGGGAGRGRRGGQNGPPPPPPPDAKEDPRAAAGRKVSYHDMDDVAEGDVELMY
ncbi:hypothetical protein M422DRAFT_55259 [Sphaerobolus stellatus SS14]|uniref:C2H2-type domain-containing protein n=1 Tax=Sphaerobolus stellatus (strain SS14) TaxID=990650 RepID=A0A0C9UND6_SPHS4|nr:hypothetical protein M422DRAFT_55259 [Sphaerobolus stellatus SS14]